MENQPTNQQTVSDVIKLMRKSAAEHRSRCSSPSVTPVEMESYSKIAQSLEYWAEQFESLTHVDLRSAVEQSKSMKRVVSPTGTVHIVEYEYTEDEGPEYQNAKIVACHYKSWEGIDGHDVFWEFTEKDVTCINCLRALERGERNGHNASKKQI